MPGKVHVLST